MRTLLSLLSMLLIFPLAAQVGNDPMLLHKNGLPVAVPSKAPTRYNEYQRSRIEMSPVEIPGTLRRGMDMPVHQTLDEPGLQYNISEYDPRIITRDTTRIFLFDSEGRPYRDVSRIYESISPDSADQVEIPLPDNETDSLPPDELRINDDTDND